jgi:hypothetical protein
MEVKVVHCQGIGSRKHVLELGEPMHKRGITEADLSKPGLSGCTKSFALPVGQLSELSWPYRLRRSCGFGNGPCDREDDKRY